MCIERCTDKEDTGHAWVKGKREGRAHLFVRFYGQTRLHCMDTCMIYLSMGGRPPLAVCLALSRNLSLLTQISHAWPLWHGSPSVLRKIQRDLAVDDAKVTVNSRSASHL